MYLYVLGDRFGGWIIVDKTLELGKKGGDVGSGERTTAWIGYYYKGPVFNYNHILYEVHT